MEAITPKLVGGFNQPLGKICSNWIISPGIGVKIPEIFQTNTWSKGWPETFASQKIEDLLLIFVETEMCLTFVRNLAMMLFKIKVPIDMVDFGGVQLVWSP